jgi:hypothetical protein
MGDPLAPSVSEGNSGGGRLVRLRRASPVPQPLEIMKAVRLGIAENVPWPEALLINRKNPTHRPLKSLKAAQRDISCM